jgi:hypothetical protein
LLAEKARLAMQVNEFDDRIKVGAVFTDGQIIPKWFFWGHDKHTIKAVEHSWASKEGGTPVRFFSVTDGCNVYELRLTLKTAEWKLLKVYIEG